MTRTEENRNWNYEDFEREYTVLLKCVRLKIGPVRLNFSINLDKQIQEYDPNFIIAAGSYIHPCLWELQKIAHKRKVPVFFWSESHLHTIRDYGRLTIFIREFLRKTIYKGFNGFFYAGKYSREFIEQYCSSSSKLIFLPNLIDDKYYLKHNITSLEINKIIEKYNIKNFSKIFICPARLSNDKGLMPFLKLLVEIKTKTKYVLLIAGDGELLNDLQNFINEHKLNVKLLGFQTQNDMRELYQVADGFILPSIVDPNPLTCIEALWSGLPILISNLVGNGPEVVEQGINGYIFKYNSSDNIEIIKKYIESTKEWHDNACHISLLKANELYNSQKQVKRIINEIVLYINSK